MYSWYLIRCYLSCTLAYQSTSEYTAIVFLLHVRTYTVQPSLAKVHMFNLHSCMDAYSCDGDATRT